MKHRTMQYPHSEGPQFPRSFCDLMDSIVDYLHEHEVPAKVCMDSEQIGKVIIGRKRADIIADLFIALARYDTVNPLHYLSDDEIKAASAIALIDPEGSVTLGQLISKMFAFGFQNRGEQINLIPVEQSMEEQENDDFPSRS